MSKQPILADTNQVCVTLGGAGGKTVDTRGTFENFGFTTEGQKCTPMNFFMAGGQGN